MPETPFTATSPGLSRRQVLSGLVASASLSLSGCGGEFVPVRDSGRRTRLPGRAGLIAPMTGRAAGLGQIIRNSATLGGNVLSDGGEMQLYDTGDSAEGAALAARQAVDGGARMIVGPLFGAQARAAAAAAPGIPVLTLSNDTSIAGRGVFVTGVSPEQSAQSVLTFAQRRGLASVGIVVPPGPFGERASAAALQEGRSLGLTMIGPVAASSPAQTEAALGAMPSALYLPSAGQELAPLAQAFRGRTQLLGSDQWSLIDPTQVAALEGAFYASADPLAFEPFARAYREAHGETPGILAGVAFDAIESVRLLGRIGQQDTPGLLRENGFNGVIGPYRFERDGRCRRRLAVLRVGRGEVSLVGASSA